MKPVSVCIPTLKRYDLLKGLVESLAKSTLQPHAVHVIDNGFNPTKMAEVVSTKVSFPIYIRTPKAPMGVAESWNYFLRTVPEERIIANDDVVFAPESLEKIVNTPGDWVSGLGGAFGASCFLIRDGCVAKVGPFDESISPGYAYYEDSDYFERMRLCTDLVVANVDAGVQHVNGGSQTFASYDDDEMNEHHRRFKLARQNFINKWGRMPR